MGDRRRLTVWFSEAEWAGLDATAAAVEVETGALVREAALRGAAVLARDVSAGHVKLRRRSSVVAPAAAGGSVSSLSSEAAESEQLDPGVLRAMAFRAAALRR